MANVAAICNSFKTELLFGIHAFGAAPVRAAGGVDAFKIALYTPSGSLGAGSTTYNTSNEVVSAGYTAGGAPLTWIAPTAGAGTVAYTTPNGPVQWTGVTFNTDCALIYNFTQGNKTVAVYTFSAQNVVGGNFTLTMPNNDASFGLLRIA